MTLFRKYLIGGATGSREGAWFLVLTLVVVPLWVIIIGEFAGKNMSTASGALMVIGPAVLTLWAVAHGLQKVIENRREPEWQESSS